MRKHSKAFTFYFRHDLGKGSNVVLLILQANAEMSVSLDVSFSTAYVFAEVK